MLRHVVEVEVAEAGGVRYRDEVVRLITDRAPAAQIVVTAPAADGLTDRQRAKRRDAADGRVAVTIRTSVVFEPTWEILPQVQREDTGSRAAAPAEPSTVGTENAEPVSLAGLTVERRGENWEVLLPRDTRLVDGVVPQQLQPLVSSVLELPVADQAGPMRWYITATGFGTGGQQRGTDMAGWLSRALPRAVAAQRGEFATGMPRHLDVRGRGVASGMALDLGAGSIAAGDRDEVTSRLVRITIGGQPADPAGMVVFPPEPQVRWLEAGDLPRGPVVTSDFDGQTWYVLVPQDGEIGDHEVPESLRVALEQFAQQAATSPDDGAEQEDRLWRVDLTGFAGGGSGRAREVGAWLFGIDQNSLTRRPMRIEGEPQRFVVQLHSSVPQRISVRNGSLHAEGSAYQAVMTRLVRISLSERTTDRPAAPMKIAARRSENVRRILPVAEVPAVQRDLAVPPGRDDAMNTDSPVLAGNTGLESVENEFDFDFGLVESAYGVLAETQATRAIRFGVAVDSAQQEDLIARSALLVSQFLAVNDHPLATQWAAFIAETAWAGDVETLNTVLPPVFVPAVEVPATDPGPEIVVPEGDRPGSPPFVPADNQLPEGMVAQRKNDDWQVLLPRAGQPDRGVVPERMHDFVRFLAGLPDRDAEGPVRWHVTASGYGIGGELRGHDLAEWLRGVLPGAVSSHRGELVIGMPDHLVVQSNRLWSGRIQFFGGTRFVGGASHELSSRLVRVTVARELLPVGEPMVVQDEFSSGHPASASRNAEAPGSLTSDVGRAEPGHGSRRGQQARQAAHPYVRPNRGPQAVDLQDSVAGNAGSRPGAEGITEVDPQTREEPGIWALPAELTLLPRKGAQGWHVLLPRHGGLTDGAVPKALRRVVEQISAEPDRRHGLPVRWRVVVTGYGHGGDQRGEDVARWLSGVVPAHLETRGQGVGSQRAGRHYGHLLIADEVLDEFASRLVRITLSANPVVLNEPVPGEPVPQAPMGPPEAMVVPSREGQWNDRADLPQGVVVTAGAGEDTWLVMVPGQGDLTDYQVPPGLRAEVVRFVEEARTARPGQDVRWVASTTAFAGGRKRARAVLEWLLGLAPGALAPQASPALRESLPLRLETTAVGQSEQNGPTKFGLTLLGPEALTEVRGRVVRFTLSAPRDVQPSANTVAEPVRDAPPPIRQAGVEDRAVVPSATTVSRREGRSARLEGSQPAVPVDQQDPAEWRIPSDVPGDLVVMPGATAGTWLVLLPRDASLAGLEVPSALRAEVDLFAAGASDHVAQGRPGQWTFAATGFNDAMLRSRAVVGWLLGIDPRTVPTRLTWRQRTLQRSPLPHLNLSLHTSAVVDVGNEFGSTTVAAGARAEVASRLVRITMSRPDSSVVPQHPEAAPTAPATVPRSPEPLLAPVSLGASDVLPESWGASDVPPGLVVTPGSKRGTWRVLLPRDGRLDAYSVPAELRNQLDRFLAVARLAGDGQPGRWRLRATGFVNGTRRAKAVMGWLLGVDPNILKLNPSQQLIERYLRHLPPRLQVLINEQNELLARENFGRIRIEPDAFQEVVSRTVRFTMTGPTGWQERAVNAEIDAPPADVDLPGPALDEFSFDDLEPDFDTFDAPAFPANDAASGLLESAHEILRNTGALDAILGGSTGRDVSQEDLIRSSAQLVSRSLAEDGCPAAQQQARLIASSARAGDLAGLIAVLLPTPLQDGGAPPVDGGREIAGDRMSVDTRPIVPVSQLPAGPVAVPGGHDSAYRVLAEAEAINAIRFGVDVGSPQQEDLIARSALLVSQFIAVDDLPLARQWARFVAETAWTGDVETLNTVLPRIDDRAVDVRVADPVPEIVEQDDARQVPPPSAPTDGQLPEGMAAERRNEEWQVLLPRTGRPDRGVVPERMRDFVRFLAGLPDRVFEGPVRWHVTAGGYGMDGEERGQELVGWLKGVLPGAVAALRGEPVAGMPDHLVVQVIGLHARRIAKFGEIDVQEGQREELKSRLVRVAVVKERVPVGQPTVVEEEFPSGHPASAPPNPETSGFLTSDVDMAEPAHGRPDATAQEVGVVSVAGPELAAALAELDGDTSEVERFVLDSARATPAGSGEVEARRWAGALADASGLMADTGLWTSLRDRPAGPQAFFELMTLVANDVYRHGRNAAMATADRVATAVRMLDDRHVTEYLLRELSPERVGQSRWRGLVNDMQLHLPRNVDHAETLADNEARRRGGTHAPDRPMWMAERLESGVDGEDLVWFTAADVDWTPLPDSAGAVVGSLTSAEADESVDFVHERYNGVTFVHTTDLPDEEGPERFAAQRAAIDDGEYTPSWSPWVGERAGTYIVVAHGMAGLVEIRLGDGRLVHVSGEVLGRLVMRLAPFAQSRGRRFDSITLIICDSALAGPDGSSVGEGVLRVSRAAEGPRRLHALTGEATAFVHASGTELNENPVALGVVALNRGADWVTYDAGGGRQQASVERALRGRLPDDVATVVRQGLHSHVTRAHGDAGPESAAEFVRTIGPVADQLDALGVFERITATRLPAELRGAVLTDIVEAVTRESMTRGAESAFRLASRLATALTLVAGTGVLEQLLRESVRSREAMAFWWRTVDGLIRDVATETEGDDMTVGAGPAGAEVLAIAVRSGLVSRAIDSGDFAGLEQMMEILRQVYFEHGYEVAIGLAAGVR
ncbi:hypothetical protein SK854_04655 [Lentzea sp. BCCO 10_0061]|uniref:Uncharacterized protein n=1 Tax=Lentzea sokolovensis TaxID=3095429 RepID=A0ABU4UQF7_9PSEU|nr:hypothetical protein [Lentzea sp. BCCO 10_0061]MDX8141392.1 hypothetical protein [Lentzea sp. BCCO 10_0061]